jgi:hypothetical protein
MMFPVLLRATYFSTYLTWCGRVVCRLAYIMPCAWKLPIVCNDVKWMHGGTDSTFNQFGAMTAQLLVVAPSCQCLAATRCFASPGGHPFLSALSTSLRRGIDCSPKATTNTKSDCPTTWHISCPEGFGQILISPRIEKFLLITIDHLYTTEY